jgi:hypothetical protein
MKTGQMRDEMMEHIAEMRGDGAFNEWIHSYDGIRAKALLATGGTLQEALRLAYTAGIQRGARDAFNAMGAMQNKSPC